MYDDSRWSESPAKSRAGGVSGRWLSGSSGRLRRGAKRCGSRQVSRAYCGAGSKTNAQWGARRSRPLGVVPAMGGGFGGWRFGSGPSRLVLVQYSEQLPWCLGEKSDASRPCKARDVSGTTASLVGSVICAGGGGSDGGSGGGGGLVVVRIVVAMSSWGLRDKFQVGCGGRGGRGQQQRATAAGQAGPRGPVVEGRRAGGRWANRWGAGGRGSAVGSRLELPSLAQSAAAATPLGAVQWASREHLGGQASQRAGEPASSIPPSATQATDGGPYSCDLMGRDGAPAVGGRLGCGCRPGSAAGPGPALGGLGPGPEPGKQPAWSWRWSGRAPGGTDGG